MVKIDPSDELENSFYVLEKVYGYYITEKLVVVCAACTMDYYVHGRWLCRF